MVSGVPAERHADELADHAMVFACRTPTGRTRIAAPSTVRVFGLWSVRPTEKAPDSTTVGGLLFRSPELRVALREGPATGKIVVQRTIDAPIEEGSRGGWHVRR